MATYKIAIDGMGGDHAPHVVIKGIEYFLNANDHKDKVHFFVFGQEKELRFLIDQTRYLKKCCEIVHCDQVVENHTKPLNALRSFRCSSMALAVKAVQDDDADAVISSGNTGAYMAFSKVILKTFPFIDRPAIPAVIPSVKGFTVMLDLGANVECSSQNLVQFSVLGHIYAQEYLKSEHPRIGLLNIGVEDIKGHAILQETADFLSTIGGLNYIGFVEGNDITNGQVDVVVTDGFTGNVALKSIEGTAHLITHFMKESVLSSWRGKIGYMIAKPAFDHFKQKSNPSLYNGAIFLGLKKIAVKSHGGSNEIGFASAVRVTVDMLKRHLTQKIEECEYFKDLTF
jgi:glycerol-3-phosphate acyltransferase PlsX